MLPAAIDMDHRSKILKLNYATGEVLWRQPYVPLQHSLALAVFDPIYSSMEGHLREMVSPYSTLDRVAAGVLALRTDGTSYFSLLPDDILQVMCPSLYRL